MNLLYELRTHGIRAELLPGGRIRLTPEARVTPEIVAAVRAAKFEIVRELRVQETWRTVADFWRNNPSPNRSESLQRRTDNVSDRLTATSSEHRFCRLCRLFAALNTRRVVADYIPVLFPEEVHRYDA